MGTREIGGARRDRTDDLLHAMQALSQLSYDPTVSRQTKKHFGSGKRAEPNSAPFNNQVKLR